MSSTATRIDLRPLAAAVRPVDSTLERLLARYEALVRRLVDSPLFGVGRRIGATFEATGEGFEVRVVSPLSETELAGTAATFRQLWMHGEPYRFVVVSQELRKHAESLRTAAAAKTVDYIDALGRQYKEVRRASPGLHVLEASFNGDEVTSDGPVRAESILEDWLHGEFMHSDDSRRERLGDGGARQMNELALLAALQDMTNVYLNLARLTRLIVDPAP